MNRRRWWLDDYQLNINPYSQDESLKATAQPAMTVNGLITNPNAYYTRTFDFNINIVDQPTAAGKPIKTHTGGYYTAASYDEDNDQTYLLKPTGLGAVDVVDLNGTIIKAFSMTPVNYATSGGVVSYTGVFINNLLDGDANTSWDMQSTSGNAIFNLGTVKTFNQFTFSVNSGYSGNVQVDYSTDGSTYYSAGAMSMVYTGGFIDIQPTAAQFVKLTVTGVSGGTQYLSDFKVRFNPPSTASGVAYMEGEVGWFYPNIGSGCALVVTDENGNETRKYYYATNTDLKDTKHITYDHNGFIYALNRYGMVNLIDKTSGSYEQLMVMSDYNANLSQNLDKYSGIHWFKNYMGLIYGNLIYYYDTATLAPVHSVVMPVAIKAIASGDYNRVFPSITDTTLYNVNMNLSAIDLDIIKKKLAKGLVKITDDSNVSRTISIQGMNVRRIAEIAETRLDISFNATML